MNYELVVYCSRQYAQCLDLMYPSWVKSEAERVHIFTDWTLALPDKKVVVNCAFQPADQPAIHRCRRIEALWNVMTWNTTGRNVGAYILIDADVWVRSLPRPADLRKRTPLQAALADDADPSKADSGVVIVQDDHPGLEIVDQWYSLQRRLSRPASLCRDDPNLADTAFETVFQASFPVGRADDLNHDLFNCRPQGNLANWKERSQRALFVHFGKRVWEKVSPSMIFGED